MDSLSHLALGASIGIAVMGRRTALWKAALWGAVCNNLPDLDTFIGHGDAISDMTLHRGASHALFYLTLAAPPIAWAIVRLQRETALYARWWLTVWLALLAHPLLDLMTVYGTQLLRPFDERPYGVGSIFIIDPLYTLPLLVGGGLALSRRSRNGARWNAAGLAISTLYLAWSFAAQQHATAVAHESLRAQGIAAERLLVTPAPFNTLLWRVLAMTQGSYHEGYYALLDRERRIEFTRFERGAALIASQRDNPHVQRLADFSHGFYKLEQRGDEVQIADLRMGQEPTYFFRYTIAELRDSASVVVAPRPMGTTSDARRTLPWLWRRMWGDPLPPPR